MKSVEEISQYLYETARKGVGKEVFKEVLEVFGNPQDNLNVIHIVGTNGKGSTANFLTDIIKTKYKVGTFTSPSLLVLNDRIKINQEYISDQDFVRIFNYVFDEYEKFQLGFFELLTLISLIYFNEQKIDYAVYEAGIGGLYDCTSIIESKVLVLTSVGFDHIDILGNTLSEIASNKVRALKPNATLITHRFNDEIDTVINTEIGIKNAKLIIARTFNLESLTMSAEYQSRNASLAIESAILLGFSEFECIEAIKLSKWKGRLEKISPTVIIDGAHNLEGLEASIKEVTKIFGKNNFKIIASFLAEKPLDNMYDILSSGSENIKLTTFNYRRAYEKDDLINTGYNVCDNHIDEILECIKNNQNCLITGSLYFVSSVLKDLKELNMYE